MKLKNKSLWKIGLGLFLLYLCIHYWPRVAAFGGRILGAAWPLVLGGLMAYILNILMSWYERHLFANSSKPAVIKGRRGLCMILALVTLLAVIALVTVLIVPQLISCVQLILAELPGAIENVVAWGQRSGLLPEDLAAMLESIDWKGRIEEMGSTLLSGLGGVMGTLVKTVSSVFSGTITTLLALIFAFYILVGKDRLGRQIDRVMKRYLSDRRYGKVHKLIWLVDDCFHGFIVGQCTEAVILGLLCFGGMLLFRLPYAAMISALVAFTALIPVAGAYIGAFVGAFMILTVSPAKALGFLLFIVILQQLEGNLIYPRVVGQSLRLPGIWVLAAVTVGGGVMGVAGMLIGVPLAAVLYRLLREDVCRGEDGSEEKVCEAGEKAGEEKDEKTAEEST